MTNANIQAPESQESIKIKRKSIMNDVFILVSGTTIAQVISIASAPITTRLYGADAYGLSALFSSILGIIAIIACFRFETSIMIPKADEEAANLLALSLLISAITSLSLIPILWLLGNPLLSLLNANELQTYLWLIPPMVFISGSFSAINYWNTREKKFKRLSITQVSKTVSTSGTQLGAGFAGYASGGSLIGASVVGQIVATTTLGFQAWKEDKELLGKNVSRKKIKEVFYRFQDYPKFDVLTAFINTLSLQMPIFILSAFFTTAIVGYYSLGLMILQMPMTYIGASITQVFFQRAAEANNTSRVALSSITEYTVGRLIGLGFLPLMLLSVIGRDLFTLAFGVNWGEAGTYAQILSFWILIQFITSPMTILFNVQNNLRASLVFQTLIAISRVIPLIIGGLLGNVYLTLILLSVSGTLSYSAECAWLFKRASVSLVTVFQNISKLLFLGTFIITLVIISKYVFEFAPIIFVSISIIGLLIYYGVAMHFHNG